MNKQELIKKYSYQEGQESTAESEGKLYQLDTLFKLVENRKPTTIKVSDLQWVLKYTEVDEKRIASIIDLSTPLLVYKSKKTGQYITLDGAHRLTKAVREKVKELPVYFLNHQDLKKAEIPLAKLTQSRTPEQLLTWMSKNLTYEGKYKGYLRNPEQVVKDKKGHCWETSELANRELTALGYVCQTLYLVNNDLYDQDTVTHSTIIFKDKLNKYFWFEWSWYKQEGIHGPFKNLNETINFVISCFKKQYGTISTVKISGVGLMHLTTEVEYVNSVNKWDGVVLEPFKNVIFKW